MNIINTFPKVALLDSYRRRGSEPTVDLRSREELAQHLNTQGLSLKVPELFRKPLDNPA